MYTIRQATPADARAITKCHIDCLAETYEQILPPEFADGCRNRFDEHLSWTLSDLEEAAQAHAQNRQPRRTTWVAFDAEGEIVGIAASGPGRANWDKRMNVPDPLVDFNFDHMYTLRRTYGTGLGQRFLNLCLPDYHEAFLWVLTENRRARAMYERNGFIFDGVEVPCGEDWFNAPMMRMYRTRKMALASRQAQIERRTLT